MSWLQKFQEMLRGTLTNDQARLRAENDELIGRHPIFYFIGALGVTLFFASLALQTYLQATAPRKPEIDANQVSELHIKGEIRFVRPWEYYFASIGPGVGFGLVLVSGVLFEWSRRKR
jgi:hypothetical protein